MGIKTLDFFHFCVEDFFSEKPPHHMGIKTTLFSPYGRLPCSEKLPLHSGILARQTKAV